MSFSFDTLEYTKRLRDADLPPKQAEALAEALKHALGSGPNAVATKADLDALENRLVIKLGGLMIAVGGLVAAFPAAG
jgi:hypothetical protein